MAWKSAISYILRRETKRIRAKPVIPCFREKPLGRIISARTKTDTGGRVEHTEAIGGTVVKELGKMAPQLREKGCRLG